MHRREFLIGTAGLALSPFILLAQGGAPLSRQESVEGWKRRLRGMLDRGKLPIIDLQATYVPGRTNIGRMMQYMNELDVAQIAFAAARADNSTPSLQLHRQYPEYFIPTTNSGEFSRWWRNPETFLSHISDDLKTGNYFFMGEHEFRHLPSPEQLRAGRDDRDISIALDGTAGHELFRLSEEFSIAFQIHYEVEDRLFPALESMLKRYPKARVIWCHLAMIRYPERAKRYDPEYVGSLVARFPGLHFDLAVPPATHVYGPSGARDSMLYNPSGELNERWHAVIEQYPERFLASSDYRPPLEHRYPDQIMRQRQILAALNQDTRHLVAYGNAYRLITGTNWEA